mgnify:CR=1 FL=1
MHNHTCLAPVLYDHLDVDPMIELIPYSTILNC